MDQLSQSVAWVIAACILGFAISAVFAWKLQFSRKRFLFPYVLLAAVFLVSYVILDQVDVAALLANGWQWGMLAGILVGAFVIRHVQSQPKTRQVSGSDLWIDVLWSGVAYGLTDALFLNVMPVVAVYAVTSQMSWTASLPGKIGAAVLGLAASLLVAVAYHLGYPEFHGQKMRWVLIGNSIITLAFLISGNPLGSIIAHTGMHIAAVLRGPDTTIQLPPHYEPLRG